MEMPHAPVLLLEAVAALAIKEDGIYIDATFGRGGHSRAILGLLGASGTLLACDRDVEAISSDSAAQLRQDPRFELVHQRFGQLQRLVAARGWCGKIDGVLLDIGVSSPQLDDPARGFSFQGEGPLDMRMDRQAGPSATEWLAQVTEQELARVLDEYGEERFARRIAKAVVRQRLTAPLRTTRQLAELIERAVPVRDKFKHPATRSFQAIRIAVNAELDELRRGLVQAVAALKPGGRLVVITFHSLEDRIVKRFIRNESGYASPIGKLPPQDAELPALRLKKIGKAQRPSAEEVSANPRARSAVLRVAERL